MRMRAVDVFTQLVAKRRRRRRITPRPVNGIVKANLGSSLTVADGWLNVDVGLHALFANWPLAALRALHRLSGFRAQHTADEYASILKDHDYCHHDLTYGVPLPDDSADFVFTSHFLEHLFVEDARHFVNEIWRVLRPGGIARICVPDLEIAVEWYRQGEKEKALSQFYPPIAWGHFAQHRYLYDFAMLHGLLEQAGFTDIERRSFREGAVPDLDVLDVRPEETLYVEAVKPARSTSPQAPSVLLGEGRDGGEENP